MEAREKIQKVQSQKIEETARMYGCTVEQLQNQIRNNVKDLRNDLLKASATGKKIRGASAKEIKAAIVNYQVQYNL